MSGRPPIKTLHLTNAWHPSSGGVRTFYLALLAEAERRGRAMTVVVPGEKDDLACFGSRTRLVTLRAPRVPLLDRRYRAIWPHRFAVPVQTRLWRVIADERPDVIEVCDKYSLCHLAGLIKRRHGPRPTVIGLSQERMDDALAAHVLPRPTAVSVADMYLRRVYMRQFDAHVANSEYTAGELRLAAAAGGPAKPLLWRLRNRIYVEPLGVDLEGFSPSARSEGLRGDLVRRLGLRSVRHLALFAGRLSSEKNVLALLPALEQCLSRGLDIGLAIAGDGPLFAAVSEEARRRAPGRVLMLGHVTLRQELASLVASADLFVHPNPREPFGIGPLEAMACGTPVVVPASGGVLTYASRRNAWLAEDGHRGLADAIESCCRHQGEAGWRRIQGLTDAARFAWPLAAARYFDTYDTIHAIRTTEWTARISAADRTAVETLVDVSH